MKLVSYTYKKVGETRIGAIHGDRIIDLQEAHRQFLQSSNQETDVFLLPSNPNAFYRLGHTGIRQAQAAFTYAVDRQATSAEVERSGVRLELPVPNPEKIICIGTNYADHVKEMNSTIPEYPVLFAKFANALIGPEDSIEKSPATEKLDYEVELAVVIGKRTKKVAREEAKQYIAGYTIGNDISARDLQKRTPQWLQGKTLDRSTPIGPWIVTADEIQDPGNLAVKSYINGEKRQSSNTSELIFDVPYLVSFLSELMTLQPGDIILTGTPHGVGFAMDPPTFLQAGDRVTMEIEKIGTMENYVIDQDA
ncbi:fumarylacetoacetate hydrolase family protein [Sediminibacillus halophilus]|uniref:2-keto-4-pentenoate hydratase/2-oxohepta-3-ene-1,7-dioic acid hydratase (Catechol pathway) n=1 Tax=Sediminibacillus halophilus TaxID=482461 RepID=A0A1G9TGU4_9BACI|nr:fumarylacetoacetate hydrolase family protein [Sediminibacillus halophilus]SDM46956.1 2-keto-4-pentenoate hydratase/2-oxohepta-3-ene-1,7-dioic acid hydratase (catechol pathway) [Sediminibacillus halophilus]